MATAEASASNAESLRGTVAALSAEVARLKRDLHGTDTVALRRACKSLAQHVTALQEESKKVEANISALQEELLKSSDIAQAVIETGSVAAGSFAITRALRASPLQWSSSFTNPAIKRQLVSDWKHLQERITIMSQLLDWAQSDALTQQQNMPLSDNVELPSAPPLPAATAPPYA